MGKFWGLSILTTFIFSSSVGAVGVKITGTSGAHYRGECRTTSGQKLKISGRIPQAHKFKTKKSILLCKINKRKSSGVLKLSVDQSRKISGLHYIDRDAADIVLELPKGQRSGAVKFDLGEIDRRGARNVGFSKTPA